MQQAKGKIMLYIRFTNEPQKDLERGFSFAGYEMYSSKKEAEAAFAEYGDSDKVAQDNVTGLWGRRLSGLCGFEIESIDDVDSVINEEMNYRRNYAVVYEGYNSFDSDFDGGDDEGSHFTPSSIVKIVKM